LPISFTRQITLPEPVQTSEQISEPANALMRAELGPGRLFRLVGVGVSGFAQHDSEVSIREFNCHIVADMNDAQILADLEAA